MGEGGEPKGRHACLVSDDAERGHGEGNERRGIPFTPSPGNVFSCVTRHVCGIFHPDRGRVITTAPGNSFWSKERILGARDARDSSRKTLQSCSLSSFVSREEFTVTRIGR